MSATRDRLVQAVAKAIRASHWLNKDGEVLVEEEELAEIAVDAVMLASVDEAVGRYIEEITAAYAERAKQ